MAERGSYTESMTGVPDSTQDTASKSNVPQEVQPTGQAKAFLEMYSKYASNILDITAGQMLSIQGMEKSLREYGELTGQSAKEVVECAAGICIKATADKNQPPEFTPEINLSDSFKTAGKKGDIMVKSLYMKLYRFLEKQSANTDGNPILCRMATDYYFIVNYDTVRPMDTKRLLKVNQTEALHIYKRLLEFSKSDEVRSMVFNKLPEISAIKNGLPELTKQESRFLYIDCLFKFSESEKAVGEKSIDDTPETKKGFAVMLAGPATSMFAGINTRGKNKKGLAIDKINDRLEITNERLTVYVSNYKKLRLSLGSSTAKLLDALTIRLTKEIHYRYDAKNNLYLHEIGLVQLPLEEYLTMRGIEPTKDNIDNARKKIKTDLLTLKNAELKWSEKKKKGKGDDFYDLSVLDSKGIIDGFITARFGIDFMEYLSKSSQTQIDERLFQLSERNPYLYPVGRELNAYYLMDGNANKIKNGYISISIKSLLKYFFGLPDFEKVRAVDRNYRKHIIDPIENTLTELENKGLIEFDYCNAKHEPLTGEQYKDIYEYNTYMSLYVKYKWLDAPDRTERRKVRQIAADRKNKLIEKEEAKIIAKANIKAKKATNG